MLAVKWRGGLRCFLGGFVGKLGDVRKAKMAASLPVKMATVGWVDKEQDGCPGRGRLLLSGG